MRAEEQEGMCGENSMLLADRGSPHRHCVYRTHVRVGHCLQYNIYDSQYRECLGCVGSVH